MVVPPVGIIVYVVWGGTYIIGLAYLYIYLTFTIEYELPSELIHLPLFHWYFPQRCDISAIISLFHPSDLPPSITFLSLRLLLLPCGCFCFGWSPNPLFTAATRPAGRTAQCQSPCGPPNPRFCGNLATTSILHNLLDPWFDDSTTL